MRKMIDTIGPLSLRIEKNRFGMLVRSVLSQQLSTSAARTIRKRVEQLTKGPIRPNSLEKLSLEKLRAAGVSNQKAACILEIANAAMTKRIQFNQLGRYSDEAIIEQLTQIKGIGRWTAQMFLIFALGRMDVFPVDDLGVRSAIRNEYGLSELPDKKTAEQIAQPWRPFASVGSWYCWRAIDNARQAKTN